MRSIRKVKDMDTQESRQVEGQDRCHVCGFENCDSCNKCSLLCICAPEIIGRVESE